MMNCKKVRALLPSYAEGKTNPKITQELREHLTRCDDCQRRVMQMRPGVNSPDKAAMRLARKVVKEDHARRRRSMLLGGLLGFAFSLILILLLFPFEKSMVREYHGVLVSEQGEVSATATLKYRSLQYFLRKQEVSATLEVTLSGDTDRLDLEPEATVDTPVCRQFLCLDSTSGQSREKSQLVHVYADPDLEKFYLRYDGDDSVVKLVSANHSVETEDWDFLPN